jgi:hypothetical protein
MSKTILSICAAALVCVAASSVRADNLSSDTLSAMGLSGLQVMSDSDAISIRGMGFVAPKPKHKVSPSASAQGASFAFIGTGGKILAGAGSVNSYSAKGKYEASGSNFSEAKLTKSFSKQVDFSDGTSSGITKTYSIHVQAGGFSSAKAF